MKNTPLISIIVPIYNVEDYLAQCIDSILVQSYTNFELILVDDGSPDNCGIICDEYAEKDNRIIVIHQTNGGLSDARNSGLNIAKGEYIAFVDSDDLVHPDFIKSLYENIGGCKMIFCDLKRFENEEELISNSISPFKVQTLSQEFLFNHITDFRNPLVIVAWNKLYHKSIWKNISYPKGKVHEDEFVVHKILNECDEVMFIDTPLYYYRMRNDSIMSDNSKMLSKIQYLIESKTERLNFFNEKGFQDAVKKERKYINTCYLSALRFYSLKNLPSDYKNYFKSNLLRFTFRQKLQFVYYSVKKK